MIRYVIKRMLMLLPVIVGVTFIVFFIISLTPGDVATIILGNAATEESIAQLNEELGLDDPLIVQYGRYIGNLFTGNLGTSYATGKKVSGEIGSRFFNTFSLTIVSVALAVVISIPIGILSATKQYSLLDNVGMLAALIGISMPPFWLGLMLIIVFTLKLGWFPSGGADSISSIVLPAVTLAVASTASITRTTRSSMLEVIRQDYIRTAKAKGINSKVVTRKHALKNALIPTVTIVGLEVGLLMGGAVITETVFAWPGIGRLVVESIQRKDTPMVLGCIIVFSLCFSVANLIVDILYAYIDPRIKSNYE